MKLVTLNARQYAVDLWWQVRDGAVSSEKVLLRVARSRAEDLKSRNQETFNCVAVGRDQYGLGCYADLRIPSVTSLATAVHPPVQAVQSFLGIFHLHEGWWVCGQSRGLLSANGDRLFETEQEARAHSNELHSYFDASCVEIVCDTPEESERYLLPVLREGIRVQRLYQDAKYARRLLWAGVGGLCLLLVAGTIKWMWDVRMIEQTQNATRLLLQSKEARRREILEDPGRHFRQDWLDAPSVLARSGVYLPALMSAPLASHGWLLASATCKGDALLLAWTYRPGAVYTRLPPDGRLETAKKAVSRQNLPVLPGRKNERPLLPQKEATAHLYELTRQTGSNMRLSWGTPEKRVIHEVEVTAPWVRGTWQLDAVPAVLINSGTVFELLDALPGLSLGELHLEKRQWTLKGVVYANIR